MKGKNLALLALVLSFFLPPVGFVLALKAYKQLKEEKERRGRVYVVVAFFVSIIFTLLILQVVGVYVFIWYIL